MFNVFCKNPNNFDNVFAICVLLISRFLTSFRCCLRQMCGLSRLSAEIEALRAEAFSSSDLGHERGLLELWSLLQPGVPLETRRTKQWQSIGFQGDDPKTDFRGMGVLGLENLL